MVTNIIFGYKLVNANKEDGNKPGYDLIDKKRKVVFQISSSNSPQKIIHSIDKTIEGIKDRNNKKELLEKYKTEHPYPNDEEKHHIQTEEKKLKKMPDIVNGRIRFLFLKRKKELKEVINYKGRNGNGYIHSSLLVFEPDMDILCIDDLIGCVNYLSEEDSDNVIRLKKFIQRNNNIFIKRQDTEQLIDGVGIVIKEYSDNFVAPMFLHIYKQNKDKVTLKNLFIDPKLSPVLGRCSRRIRNESNIVEILDDFLWNKEEIRLLFIDGDAAIGKTSLISWMCYHYKELDRIGKALFCGRKLVCIRLRELDFDESKSPEGCILKYLNAESIEELERRYMDSVIILEGLDELSMVQDIRATSIEEFILDVRKIFRNHKIIVTSRPRFIDMDKIQHNGVQFYQFSIQHFDSIMRRQWLESYGRVENVSEYTKIYIENITDLEADGVADTPLALYLLAACNVKVDLRSNKWSLFHEIFNNAIITTRYNENLKLSSAHPVLANLKVDILYNIVGEIALKMLFAIP